MNAAHSDAHDSQNSSAEATDTSLRGRIRPLPAETDDETFLPFLDLCFNWSMDRPRIDIDELAHRSDAVFYFRDWGRDGDIAVAAHAEADAQSPIIGLAWVRLADIADVVGKVDEGVSGDFAAALGKTGAEVVRSEVVPDGSAEDSADRHDLAPADDGAPFTGYGWVAADIPELSVAVLPEHQGQGIGGALVDTVCTLARMSGFPAVSLSVEDGNTAAKLYTDHGFVSVGRNGDSDVLVRRLKRD
ncbi:MULTISPECIES: GNAT family N-acetyltransferase [unclassified Brevibacterium]|uniref:GNAT family N-acetyltransferase n=1 Tax=unclassified Brevibacterium TaxID=2614124 RepID=UPI0010931899|nr:GNAT family N-acetyltransferase [Brevibacterium sp. S22]TGD30482.1 GNAT family N-acetyltransferase [Brevibacterium sp. S22]